MQLSNVCDKKVDQNKSENGIIILKLFFILGRQFKRKFVPCCPPPTEGAVE